MDSLATLTGGAPVAGVLLAVMIGASAIGLIAAPGLIERSLFRPHWLIPNNEYATLVTSGLVLFLVTLIVNMAARYIVSRRAEFSGAN